MCTSEVWHSPIREELLRIFQLVLRQGRSDVLIFRRSWDISVLSVSWSRYLGLGSSAVGSVDADISDRTCNGSWRIKSPRWELNVSTLSKCILGFSSTISFVFSCLTRDLLTGGLSSCPIGTPVLFKGSVFIRFLVHFSVFGVHAS